MIKNNNYKLHHIKKNLHISNNNKYTLIKYDEPIIKDMAIILIYFNPNKSNRIIQNLLFVKNSLESSNIPFYIAELSFDNEPFLFQKAFNIYQYRSSSYMFYKENLIYTILQYIPDTITKICTLDGDIMFDNPKWYETVSNVLNTYNVCQPFNLAYRLRIDFTIENSSYSCLDKINNSPGFAWAFKKDWFIKNGFFEYAVIGGGDGLFYNYLTTHSNTCYSYTSKIYQNEYNKNIQNKEKLPPACSVNLTIYHLFHGKIINRQYEQRHELFNSKINQLNINNISELFIRRDDNILEWNPIFKKEMNAFIKTYFMNRQDDSV